MRSSIQLACALAAVAASANPVQKRTAHVDLQQAAGQIDPHRATLRAYARRHGAVAASTQKTGTASEQEDAGFWYGSFNVGDATGLSLLIDTGSPDVLTNPGLYKASSNGQNLDNSGQAQYETTEPNGCGNGDMAYNQMSDTVSFAGLASQGQIFGDITPTSASGDTITQFPHDGIVGFFGTSASGTQVGGTPFFQNLCNQNVVSSCRFGLAFGTSGSGQQILGTIDDSLYTGSLSTVSISSQWQAPANIIVNGTSTFQSGANVVFDSGTSNVVGSRDDVTALFGQLGIQAVPQDLPGCAQAVIGYYACDAPPTVGLSFGDGQVFNIEPSAFKLADNGGNNCTATITGIDLGGWIVGQSFFQGKYVDHNADANTMGFATLANQSG